MLLRVLDHERRTSKEPAVVRIRPADVITRIGAVRLVDLEALLGAHGVHAWPVLLEDQPPVGGDSRAQPPQRTHHIRVN